MNDSGGETSAAQRRAMLDYVERFTDILTDSGMQRMTARVFAYILVDDADTYTAAEIAEGLDISLASVSGAVRDLTTAGLLHKGRRPSTRADIYRLNDEDVWGAIFLGRAPLLDRYREVAAEGVRNRPAGPGRDRLRQTVRFMEFIDQEFDGMRRRWAEVNARIRAERETGAG